MKYEIVNLKEKKVVGITTRTRNSDTDMGEKIGELWYHLYQGGIYSTIEGKVNSYAIGLYSDYESDVLGEYSATVGCEVSDIAHLPLGTVVKVIPPGKYAKFIVKGHMQKAVCEFWEKVWDMDLDRSYIADFEEYIDCQEENATIHMYIALTE